MTLYFALLRAVNLPGYKQVGMTDLRELLTKLGFADVRSLLQSGNLAFRGKARASAPLERQLEALQPRVICCLGKFAAELLVGVKGTIGGLRGRIYRYRGAKLIVTYHPAACLRNQAYKTPVWEDMKRLALEYQTD